MRSVTSSPEQQVCCGEDGSLAGNAGSPRASQGGVVCRRPGPPGDTRELMEPLQLRGLQPATLQVPWRLPRGQMNKRRLEISTRLGGTVTVGRTAGTHPALGLPGAASLCGSRAGSRLPRAARGGRSALSKPAPRPASDPHVCGRNSRSNRRRGQSGPFVGVFWRALLSAWATPLSRDTSTVPPSGEAPKSKTNGETKGHPSRLPDPPPGCTLAARETPLRPTLGGRAQGHARMQSSFVVGSAPTRRVCP